MPHHSILVDAEYLDHVAFDLIVNFERMLGRRIPPAQLSEWLDYVALDGGLRPGDNEVRVYFVHRPEHTRLQHFVPSDFAGELHERAFRDRLGEFALSALSVESVVSADDLLVEAFGQLLRETGGDKVMLVADLDGFTPESWHKAARIKALCAEPPTGEDGRPLERKDITLFTMQPMAGRGFAQELLGYSLMAALGINADDVKD